MEITPYGVKPYMKRLLSSMKPKSGWRKIYKPMGNIDLHEEEQ